MADVLVSRDHYDHVYQHIPEIPFHISHFFDPVEVEKKILSSLIVHQDDRIILNYVKIFPLIDIPSSKKVEIETGGLKNLIFARLRHSKISKRLIVSKILRSNHILNMSLVSYPSTSKKNSVIWTHLTQTISENKTDYLDDIEIETMMHNTVRRMEYNLNRRYTISNSMGDGNDPSFLATLLNDFLRYCDLYDLHRTEAGLRRRRHLVGTFTTLIDSLRGEEKYTSTLSTMVWMPVGDSHEKILEQVPSLMNIEESLLDEDVDRYQYVVENQLTTDRVFWLLSSSVFSPLFNFHPDKYVADLCVRIQVKLVETVNALPAMSQTNRIVFLHMFTRSIGSFSSIIWEPNVLQWSGDIIDTEIGRAHV